MLTVVRSANYRVTDDIPIITISTNAVQLGRITPNPHYGLGELERWTEYPFTKKL